jgi:hypothetical protein
MWRRMAQPRHATRAPEKRRFSNGLRAGGFALPLQDARTMSKPMNDKPEIEPAVQPDLAAAIRQARVENAERAEAITDLREIEMGRLALLESALKPVVAQAPPDVDLFDLALAPGEHPRLFVDMIAFVDMAHDRRTYRFHQDTRHGRRLMAETQSAEAIASAVANYVARRLVERERALATGWRDAPEPPADDKGRRARDHATEAEAKGPRAWPLASALSRAGSSLGGGRSEAIEAGSVAWEAPPRRGFIRGFGDVLSLFLMMLGSITLALLIGLGGYLAWTMRLRDLWGEWISPPPF